MSRLIFSPISAVMAFRGDVLTHGQAGEIAFFLPHPL